MFSVAVVGASNRRFLPWVKYPSASGSPCLGTSSAQNKNATANEPVVETDCRAQVARIYHGPTGGDVVVRDYSHMSMNVLALTVVYRANQK